MDDSTAALSADATIGIVGAGAMGAGIAQVALRAGHRVVLADVSNERVADARRGIQRAFAREVEKGRMTQAALDSAMERLTGMSATEGWASFEPCAMVIEAIVERLPAKQELFRSLEGVVSPSCILATNTSSLSIASMGAALRDPSRCVGIHFFNPAPVMPLVEIIGGVATSATVERTAFDTVRGWGKTVVRAADTPGFIVNRIARPFYGESLRIFEDGVADMATIDWALTTVGGFRMGPFELMDFIGHDVNYVVTETVWTAMYYDPRYRPSLTQKRLLEAGLLGKKTGRGFYDYRDGADRPQPKEDRQLASRIVERVVAMLVNEAVDALYLRIATAADIESAMTKGVNYPKGLLAWGEEIGLDSVLASLDTLFQLTHDMRYRASPLLRTAVQTQERLAP